MTLTASGYEFSRWTDCNGVASASRECTIDLSSADREATAEFVDRSPLEVSKALSRSAQGWIHSEAPAYRINCGLSCTAAVGFFDAAGEVALEASGFEFQRWTSCPGVEDGRRCEAIPMSTTRSAEAEFVERHVLTVHKTGEGWIHSEAPEYLINCGLACTTQVGFFEAATTSVTLTASGAKFLRWTDCEGLESTSRECVIALSADNEATAEFEP